MKLCILAAKLFLATAALVSLSGCTGSRWARSDPNYAAKYPVHSSNLLQMAKQASDARHIKGRSGGYVNSTVGDSPSIVNGEIGMTSFPSSYSEIRGGLFGALGHHQTLAVGGVSGSVRLHSPTRLSPFVGIGGQIAGGEKPEGWFSEEISEPVGYFAGVFESGVHYWVTPNTRLTGFANFTAPSTGRRNDQWTFGVGFTWLPIHVRTSTDLYVEPDHSGPPKYFLTPTAKNDISELYAEYEKRDRFVAERFVNRLYDTFDELIHEEDRVSNSGQEGSRSGYRRDAGDHVVLYDMAENTVVINRIARTGGAVVASEVSQDPIPTVPVALP